MKVAIPQYVTELLPKYIDVCIASALAGHESLCLELTNVPVDDRGIAVHPGFIARGETIEMNDGYVVTDAAYAESNWLVETRRRVPSWL